ncbi:ADP-ribosylation factor family-domain-containing protein [Catenaria anguillulae PL171]|uniref:ADP-ribosylation factor family-domain-containing protein n=1 Tax=Catenaria anguillulae PL171 TaxID=765915 RepID=A0A1Y2HH75_9FUNG|nr:ADP-ribosylation factor family-domain-containing protein [Catenaria anguillulae PL171]
MRLLRNWLSRLGLVPGIRRTCVMIGLDCAGKTTIARQFGQPAVSNTDLEPTMPTVAFNASTIRQGSISLTLFDMSGNPRQRSLWSPYLLNTHAVIFVVDATDKDRIEIARRELHLALKDQVAKACPLLILCNKMDRENEAMPPDEVAGLLGLEAFKDRNWYLCGCSAITGRGLSEGFEWLIGMVLAFLPCMQVLLLTADTSRAT